MSKTVLVVDDESDIRALVREILEEEGYRVSVAGSAESARAERAALEPDLVLLDIWMPEVDGISLLKEWHREGAMPAQVVMMSGHGTVDTAVEATRLGAFDFIEKPLSTAKLLRAVERALTEVDGHQRTDRAAIPDLVEPIGRSQAMQELREKVRHLASHDAPVLIVGEPGTGREAFARYMHSESRRASFPFVNLVASSLGEVDPREVLLGDADRPGLIEQARGGVLFINELSDLPEDAQGVLLGVLEQGGFRRASTPSVIPLEAQLITSVQPGVERFMTSGRLRRDLYAHLDVASIRIPALSEYSEDVPELLRYYVDVLVDREGLSFRRFSVAAQNRLRNYPWPGNIRELKNMVHRFLILGGGEEISLVEVEATIEASGAQETTLVKQDLLALPLREAREAFERAYLIEQLKLADGKVGRLAERVGMERTNLYRKLRSLGIDINLVMGETDSAAEG
jgi:two-component system, NtrC family, nitrogen regulation response regulator NtrX